MSGEQGGGFVIVICQPHSHFCTVYSTGALVCGMAFATAMEHSVVLV